MTGAILNHLPGELWFLLRIHALVAMFALIKFGLGNYITQTNIRFHPEVVAPEIRVELGANSQRK